MNCQIRHLLLQQTVSLLLKQLKPGLAAMASPMAGPGLGVYFLTGIGCVPR
jgi:hypothetical protein